ncbi:probable pectate lyase P59 [Actinidia eriantha]|uniref:probable pectate lyase P59 n=1 Tax=Actinidia eriantha TaxID=165200 RepID=UPI00258E6E01|nr:probable pectate lyase P59 [Actinidia eriantha]
MELGFGVGFVAQHYALVILALTDNIGHEGVERSGEHYCKRGFKWGFGTLAAKRKYTGPYKATNPIDKCWRCRPNWHVNRKQLADCAIGFGRTTSRVKNGAFYAITDPSDDDAINPKTGTFRHPVTQKRPLWITFQRSRTIRLLKQELVMQSDKTIHGRRAKVHTAYDAGITIQFVRNIIIHNIHDIKITNGGMVRDSEDNVGFRTPSHGDGINIFGSKNVWLDHRSLHINYSCMQCCFLVQETQILDDDLMKITVVYNHFGKRLSRECRGSDRASHTSSTTTTLTGRCTPLAAATTPPSSARATTSSLPPDMHSNRGDSWEGPKAEWKKWTWKSQGDMLKRGAFFIES